jgi:hypothetical protein
MGTARKTQYKIILTIKLQRELIWLPHFKLRLHAVVMLSIRKLHQAIKPLNGANILSRKLRADKWRNVKGKSKVVPVLN